MNLKQFLNSVLLALSLATVMITFVSYFIYKFRQMPKRQSKGPSKIRKQGVYFSRMLPKSLEEESDVTTETSASQKSGLRLVRLNSVTGFFVVLFFVMVAAMSTENAFNFWMSLSHRKEVSDRYAILRAKGLLQERELNSSQANPQMISFLSPSQKAAFRLQTSELTHFKISIFQSPNNQKANPANLERATLGWRNFLAINQINYRVIGFEQLNGEDDLVIFPQLKALSADERLAITNYVSAGHSALFTGPVATIDDGGKLVDNKFARDLFHLQFDPNPDASTIYPSLIASDRIPFWNLAPGAMLEWKPLDNSFVARSLKVEDGSVSTQSIFESSFQGKVRNIANDDESAIVRGSYVQKNQSRVVWLANDPQTIQGGLEREQIEVDIAVASSLRWLTRQPAVKVSNFKNGFEKAILFSVDSEDKFEGALGLQKIFQQYKLPATYFVVSNLLKQFPELATGATSREEIASHTDDHTILENLNLRSQFEHISNSVLDIEEISGKEVKGFRPPEEKFDGATLNAALQQKMDYFFGGQSLQAFYPSLIAGGNLYYYSRSTIDDFNLLRNKSLATPKEISDAMYSESKRVAQVGGAEFLSLHSQVMGQEPYLEGARLFAERIAADVSSGTTWATNFREMTKWAKERQKIQLTVTLKNSDLYNLSVFNSSAEDIKDIVLMTDSSLVDPSAGVTVLADRGHGSIQIAELKAQQRLELTLKSLGAAERKLVSQAALPAMTVATKKSIDVAKKTAHQTSKKLKRSAASVKNVLPKKSSRTKKAILKGRKPRVKNDESN